MTILAWVLLTVGLCIIIITFYLAISQDPDKAFIVTVNIEDDNDNEDNTNNQYEENSLTKLNQIK